MSEVNFRGTVEKVSTYATRGGGLDLKVQTPHDPDVGAVLLENVQRPATIIVRFDPEDKVEDEGQPDLIE